ncbi:MAG: polysaccharide biosynthesis protein [Clostridia bacterium]|nr:polysaccharide biosynthesis protein [Clostridia bacterium]
MQKSAAYSAAVLAGANIACKVLGFLYKVPLANLIGGEGMGYFGFAHQIFHTVSVVAVSGVPVSLARRVAVRCAIGREEGCKGLLGAVILPLGLIGLIGALLLIAFAAPITVLAGSAKSAAALRALAPSAFFLAVGGAVKGYLQGKNDLSPVAAASFWEALAKLVFGVGAAAWLHKRGAAPEIIAAGAVFGVTFGAGIGCAILLARAYRGKKCPPQRGEAAKEVFRPALPMTAGAMILSLISTLDASFTVSLLVSSGQSAEAATALYGIYTGYALTMFSFPSALTGAVSAATMPIIAGAAAVCDRKRLKEAFLSGMTALAVIVFPAAAMYFAIPSGIMTLLFSRAGDVAEAAPLLRILSAGVVLSAFSSWSVAALQAIGKTVRATASVIIGALAKLAVGALLIPRIGISGAATAAVAGTAVSFLVSALWLGLGVGLGAVKPLVCAIPAGVIAYVLADRVQGRFAAVVPLAAAGTVYIVLMLALGGFSLGRYVRRKGIEKSGTGTKGKVYL